MIEFKKKQSDQNIGYMITVRSHLVIEIRKFKTGKSRRSHRILQNPPLMMPTILAIGV